MKKLLLIAVVAAITMSIPLWSASITVTSPAAGNDWCQGSAHTITWTKSGAMQATAAIRLRLAGSPESADAVEVIANGTANDGSFPWTVPASLAPGSYFIRVRTDDSTVIGDSGTFTVSACSASITVTSPNGSSDWCRGAAHTISWTKSGAMQDTVAIRLRAAGSSEADAAVVSIVDGTPNDGSYPWTIPASVAEGDYFIRVRTDDSTVVDDSANFHIKQCVIDPGILEKLKQRRYWEIKWPPGPDPCRCPEWKIPDLRDFRELLGEKFGGSIVLRKNGKFLQELGKFGGRRTLPGSVKANLSREDFGLLKNGGAKFSIAILDGNGSILNESALEQGAEEQLLR